MKRYFVLVCLSFFTLTSDVLADPSNVELKERYRLEQQKRLLLSLSNSEENELKKSTSSEKISSAILKNIKFDAEVSDDLNAEVEITIIPSGEILGRRLIRSSGNSSWDTAILRAVDNTGKLILSKEEIHSPMRLKFYKKSNKKPETASRIAESTISNQLQDLIKEKKDNINNRDITHPNEPTTAPKLETIHEWLEFDDLKVDLPTLIDKKVSTTAYIQSFADMHMLKSKPNDFSPVFTDISNLDRKDRKKIINDCQIELCLGYFYGVIRRGVIGEYIFVAERVRWFY